MFQACRESICWVCQFLHLAQKPSSLQTPRNREEGHAQTGPLAAVSSLTDLGPTASRPRSNGPPNADPDSGVSSPAAG